MLLAGTINVIEPTLFAIVLALVFGFGFQVWIASIQIRRFLHWFGGDADGEAKLGRLFDVYGWRARLAVRLFGIQLPPGFLERRRASNQAYPVHSGVESLVVGALMLVMLLAVVVFVYLTASR